jgi:hypothetical protein
MKIFINRIINQIKLVVMEQISRKIGTKFPDGNVILKVKRSGGNPVNGCYGCHYDSSKSESCKLSHEVHGVCTDDGGKIFQKCTKFGAWLYRLFH